MRGGRGGGKTRDFFQFTWVRIPARPGRCGFSSAQITGPGNC